jgi:hypothetical protein
MSNGPFADADARTASISDSLTSKTISANHGALHVTQIAYCDVRDATRTIDRFVIRFLIESAIEQCINHSSR